MRTGLGFPHELNFERRELPFALYVWRCSECVGLAKFKLRHAYQMLRGDKHVGVNIAVRMLRIRQPYEPEPAVVPRHALARVSGPKYVCLLSPLLLLQLQLL